MSVKKTHHRQQLQFYGGARFCEQSFRCHQSIFRSQCFMEIFNSTIHFRYDSFGAAANGTKSDVRNVGRGNGENERQITELWKRLGRKSTSGDMMKRDRDAEQGMKRSSRVMNKLMSRGRLTVERQHTPLWCSRFYTKTLTLSDNVSLWLSCPCCAESGCIPLNRNIYVYISAPDVSRPVTKLNGNMKERGSRQWTSACLCCCGFMVT